LLIVAAVLAFGASGVDGLTVTLRASGPAVVDRPWSATLLVRRGGSAVDRGRIRVTARRGTMRISSTGRRLVRGRYRITLRYPAFGRWRLTARIGRTTRRVAAIDVGTGPHDVREPFGLEAEPGGTLLVADGQRNRISRLDPARGRITAVRGGMGRPLELALGPDGSIYVIAELRVHRIAPTGEVSVVAGNGSSGYSGDGGPAVQAALDGPTSIDADAGGNLFVAEYGSRIRRVDATTGTISTVVSGGLDRPHGIAVAADGTLYVSDTYSGSLKRLRPGGSLETIAAGLAQPAGLALASDGAVLVAEHAGGAVARVDAAGRLSRIAQGLSELSAVSEGSDGSVYVAALDGSFSVGRVNASGSVTPIAR
jgi:sugar lactone lactonase YvrE